MPSLKSIIYVICFLIFIPVMFKLLKATRLDEAFKKNHINEIRIAYIILSIILANLATLALERIFSLFV